MANFFKLNERNLAVASQNRLFMTYLFLVYKVEIKSAFYTA